MYCAISGISKILITFYTGYSPLDFSVLDPHWGTWDDWVTTIDEIHARGMYFMADLTIGTMSSLIGFKGCVESSSANYPSSSWPLDFSTPQPHSLYLNTMPSGSNQDTYRGISPSTRTSRQAADVLS